MNVYQPAGQRTLRSFQNAARDLARLRQEELLDPEQVRPRAPSRRGRARGSRAPAPTPRGNGATASRALPRIVRLAQQLAHLGREIEEARLLPRVVRARVGRSTSTTRCTRPGRADMTTTRDERKTASAIEWVTNTTVALVACQIRRSSRFRRSRVISSRAPNGSSIRISAGLNVSARAIATRCCMPPESCHGWWLSKPVSSTSSSSSSTRSRRLRRSHPIISSGSETFFSTVRQSISVASWKTIP